MAPNLAVAQHELIHGMIEGGELTAKQIAALAGCSSRSVKAIRSNIKHFGTPKAPPTGSPGRRSLISSSMFDAVKDMLFQKPDRYLDEIADYIRLEFSVEVSASTISRALATRRWSKKTIKRRAKEQSAELRDQYIYDMTAFASYHLVYVDESGCDNRVGFRRTGWAPVGSTPMQTKRFHRDQRSHILPAYTQDGIMLARVYQGSTDGEVFEDFLEELLPWCGRWPQPKSVLVMDNASIHHSERVEQLCKQAGVKLVYLPPYSPDLNPIEEFFAELKAFVKRSWSVYESGLQRFDEYLEWCVDVVGARKDSARGHFRHAGVIIEE